MSSPAGGCIVPYDSTAGFHRGTDMQIKTVKPDLLIGDTVHPEGTTLDLEDRLARRLVDEGGAVGLVSEGEGKERATVETATGEAHETAAVSHKRSEKR